MDQEREGHEGDEGREEHEGFDGHRASVPPAAQHVQVQAGFGYGVVGADLHVFGDGVPVYLLLAWDPPGRAPMPWLRELPSRMLNARNAVVPFTGRTEELDDLRAWRETGPRLAVRWLYGPGGQGKTRLAHETAAAAAAEGWLVAFAVQGMGPIHPPPGSQDLRADDAAGILLIVDYADRWPPSHLTWLLSNALLHRATTPARVLLLARTDTMWPALRAALEPLYAGASSRRLEPVPDADGARAELFTAARDGFAALYGVPEPSAIEPPGPLHHPDLGLTLAVLMAALVAVDARHRGRRPPTDVAGLTLYLLDREHLHWATLPGDGRHLLPDPADDGGRSGRSGGGPAPRPYRTPPEVMNRTVFVAALTGALPRAAGAELTRRLLPGQDVEQVLADHAVCYPPTASGVVFEPLYPDRLAEDFLALTLPGHDAEYPARDWAAETTVALLARTPDGTAPNWLPRTVSALAAAAARWPHVGRGHLYPLLHRDPRLAVEAGGDALTTLASGPDIEFGLLESIEPHLPGRRHVDLDAAGLAVVGRLTAHRLEAAEDSATRARLHTDLGWRLNATGRREEALAETRRAVDHYRRAAADRPGEPDPDLAHALANLCYALSDLGHREEARSAAEEAVAAYRLLAATGPATSPSGSTGAGGYAADLAHALNTLGTTLAALGRHEPALTACEEAVALYRAMVTARPDGGTATGSETGSETDAETGEGTVVGTGTGAAASSAEEDPLVPDLAAALDNSGLWLTRLGRYEEALAVTGEASAIYRRLAAARPDEYLPDLAAALTNHGIPLLELGRLDEALTVMAGSVDAYRRLAETRPEAFEHHLATALSNLGSPLWSLSRVRESLAASVESVEIRRRLAAARPDVFTPDLATALNNLSVDLLADERPVEAHAAAHEAAVLRRRLAEEDPLSYAPYLASALSNEGNALLALDRAEEAVVAGAEAVAAYRSLADRHPDAYAALLAAALTGHAAAVRAAGRPLEALDALAEAVALRRRLTAERPDAFAADLAAALVELGDHLAALDRPGPAHAAVAEAIARYEALDEGARANPMVADGLAKALALRAALSPVSGD
ncbi:tetratricopeptide repeat protein [Streptomyces sp. LX-29]|uniref:tetratricopeptide repeat protein n=1 Tax=Streptomyces sp. LX-29 TaxID=2900152 RepID=UPI00240E748E|nr:tetratricopeptide repeat protein [Streptomyces sp. LX-29]WFB06145.1 tetratricopeptide repeat protein [Streptomyces sp. LX-29]